MVTGFQRALARILFAGALALGARAALAADTVTVGVVGSSSDVPFYIAQEKGYFRDSDIEPEFKRFDSAARMVAPLGAGQLDVGAGAVGAGLYNAVERGINIKIVADKARCAPGYGYVAFLVRKELIDSGAFKDFADLKGLKIAVGGPGTGDSSTLNEAMKRSGQSFDDLNVVFMGFAQQAAAFQNGAIDASLTAEPSVSLIRDKGSAVRFAGVDVVYPNQQTAVMLYGGDFASQRPDVAQRFMRAYIRALRDYNAALKDGKLAGPQADLVFKLLQEHTNVKDMAILRSMTPHAVDPDGALNVAGLEKDRDFFVAHGLAPASVPVSAILDDSFRKAALEQLAR